MADLLKQITQALQEASAGPVAVPLAFLLGLVSALASACCTLPAMGMLVAYSGTRRDSSRRAALASALSFLAGTTLALVILGLIAGFVGQAAQAALGKYWKLFAGVVAVVLGLAALKWLPVRFMPSARAPTGLAAAGSVGTVLAGLLLGGGVAAASLPCNPGIFIVLGAAVLQGRVLWGTLLMAAFAIGFGLPLSAILFGVSAGKASFAAQRAEGVIRGVAGVLLVGAGLYLLASF
jgi:cytochrome c biogenesis protein CcdA